MMTAGDFMVELNKQDRAAFRKAQLIKRRIIRQEKKNQRRSGGIVEKVVGVTKPTAKEKTEKRKSREKQRNYKKELQQREEEWSGNSDELEIQWTDDPSISVIRSPLTDYSGIDDYIPSNEDDSEDWPYFFDYPPPPLPRTPLRRRRSPSVWSSCDDDVDLSMQFTRDDDKGRLRRLLIDQIRVVDFKFLAYLSCIIYSLKHLPRMYRF
jgi:hypothetical protein